MNPEYAHTQKRDGSRAAWPQSGRHREVIVNCNGIVSFG